jgi:hypothetical protein
MDLVFGGIKGRANWEFEIFRVPSAVVVGVITFRHVAALVIHCKENGMDLVISFQMMSHSHIEIHCATHHYTHEGIEISSCSFFRLTISLLLGLFQEKLLISKLGNSEKLATQ